MDTLAMFSNTYRDKKVLVTGHTGFKGSWLTVWLIKLGAHVVGFSKDIPTDPSMFCELEMEKRIKHKFGDILDIQALTKVFAEEKPDFVFHLAAQAIVSTSYFEPVETMNTNIVGTMNVLEVLRKHLHPCVAIMITSDKCYDNVEWIWGYRETDNLGGKDIYSGSKGAAELVIKSYLHSFFQNGHPVKLAVGRAGNVIGGGDWARDRIVVDCVRAWSEGRIVDVRSPKATRPWQHVLEPLSGYLTLGSDLARRSDLHGQAFNFGPRAEQSSSVEDLLKDLSLQWGIDDSEKAYRIIANSSFHEAVLLKLNCDKALFNLKWESNLLYSETIKLVGEWYVRYYQQDNNMLNFTFEQISEYEEIGIERGRVWARNEN